MAELKYYAADLHLHTPASKCFEDKSVTPEEYVRASLERGLDIIAVTDHNTGEWIDRIKEAANGKGLTVIPGVEITCSGGGDGAIHIIALFPRDFGTMHITNFLGTIDIKADKFGKETAISNESVYNVITAIVEYGGLPVLAHANSTHGVLNTMSGNTRKEIVNHPKLLAAEGTDFDNQNKAEKGTRVVDLLSGLPGKYRKLAVYQASDNPGETNGTHGLGGIGTRITFFKIGERSLEGLRQCFADPDVRIRVGKPPEIAFPRIEFVEVSGGFLAGRRVDFAPGVNSILGGKGVGKSVLIELVRFALGQVSDIEEIAKDHRGKLAKRLGYGSQVSVQVITEGGDRYEILRTYDGTDDPYKVTNLISGEDYRGDVSALFPVLAYSQTEVIHIANSAEAQLRLIDRFFDHRSYDQNVQALERQLSENDQRVAGSIAARERLASLEYQKNTLDEQVRQYDRQLQNSLFDGIKILEHRRNVFEQTVMALGKVTTILQNAETGLSAVAMPPLHPGDQDDKDLASVVAASQQVLEQVRQIIKTSSELVDIEMANGATVAKTWNEAQAMTFEAYRALLVESGGNQQEVEAKRQQADKTLAELNGQIGLLREQAEAVPTLLELRSRLLSQREQLSLEHFEARQAQFQAVQQGSGGKLQLQLSHAAERGHFLGEVQRLLRGSRVRANDIQRMVENITPHRFAELFLEENSEALSKEGLMALDTAATMIKHLSSGAVALVDVLAAQHKFYLDDRPSIEFRKQDGNYYPLQDLSIGQKSTALLIIALVEGLMPVIIDQPEDSLDIPSVWEDIVVKLRQGKDKRQFILTTHNSSVAVASDSEQFLVVTSTSTSADVDVKGGIDQSDVREAVIRHLEGGEDSYNLKRNKYNL